MGMFSSLRVRANQGWQYVPDLRKAVPLGFRGKPVISEAPCADGCTACRDICPTKAVGLDPVRIDLGRCLFCDECALICPDKKIVFTPDTRMGADAPEKLVVLAGKSPDPLPVPASPSLQKLFGRSLKMRQVSAGGCNGCELELNALANVNFDLQRFGIEWVASPRHADALVLTGPVTANMAAAVQIAWDAMPEPRFVVSVGACAISGGPFAESDTLQRAFLERFAPVLFVPGCPPHPLTVGNAILDLLGVH